MRLPQPHDPDGRPCLPTHHPDPSRPHPTCPRPAPPRQRTAAPAGLPSVPDPRAARGRRHPLVAILGLAAAAVLAGARSIATIAEWAPTRPSRSGPRSAPASRLLATAASRPRPPSAGRFRAWTPTCWPAPSAPGWPPGTGTVAAGGGRAVAVDGKTLRGARAADGRPVHLLACMDHASRTVLAQRQVGGAPEEVPVFQPLLDGLDLAGAVITADALQTRPQAAEFLVTRMHAHYLFTVKANQPTLLDRCQRLPWHRVPVLDCTRDRGHGRIELRTLKAVGTARRSWPACATWSSAPSAAPGRSTSPPPCATTPATHSDPSRPLGLPSGEPGATQERPERWVLGDRWWEQRCRRPWWCRYSSAMKAAVHTSYGPPEVVRITEVDKPTPQGQRGAGQGARHDGEPDRLRLAGRLSPYQSVLHRAAQTTGDGSRE
jgi:hypothetical protein